VVEAVRASIAIPGIFTPVYRGGVWLVDGGLSNPVPVSLARAMRADCVIAIDLNNDILNGRDFGGPTPEQPPPATAAPAPAPALRRNGKPWPAWLAPDAPRNPDDVHTPRAPSARVPSMLSSIGQSIDIMQVRISRSRLAGEPADILIQPRLGGMGLFDFHRAGPAIEEGRAAVERMMPAIRARLGME
jgi:NTE family protein